MNTVSYTNILKDIPRKAPLLLAVCLLWLLAEILAILLLPQLLPSRRYLAWYLSDTAVESFSEFTKGSASYLEFDPLLGWRNRPGASFGSWSVANDGSRSSSNGGDSPLADSVDVVFLGSSLINGGTHVANEETISSYLEDNTLKARNFGTMLYEADQSILSYKTSHHALKPAVVVLGLSSDPGAGLSNRYLPFRYPAEENMPYFKPRYLIEKASLSLLPPPNLERQKSLFVSDLILDELKDTDTYYTRFSGFRFFQQLPLSSSAYYLYRKVDAVTEKSKGMIRNRELLSALLLDFKAFLAENNTRLLILLLPSKGDIAPSALKKFLPTQYPKVLEALDEEGLQVLDARTPLRETSIPLGELYHPDGNHFTAKGNRVLADALRPLVLEHTERRSSE